MELGALVRDLHGTLLPLLGEDVEVRTAFTGEAHIEADPSQLEQVVMNLVVNARDAMPRGGMLRLAVEVVDLQAMSITTGALAPGRYATLIVADTGLGMSVDTMARVFDPFFTTKAEGRGTGLGLSTVYGIVKQTGGGIRRTSTPGVGTTFTLYFPLCLMRPQPVSAGPERSATARAAARVLLVEDQAELRESVRDVLVLSGYDVRAVKDGSAALEVLETAQWPVDVLVTDILMPRMGGRELAQRVRERWPHVCVLFMSGYDPKHFMDGGELEGTVLSKPFAMEELTRRIDELMNTRPP